ncbi:retrovirus-related pol polyprotein from transposon TNT 1-94 [Tanacetum coccineum]
MSVAQMAQPQVNPYSTIAQGMPIVVLGLRRGLMGANPIPHQLSKLKMVFTLINTPLIVIVNLDLDDRYRGRRDKEVNMIARASDDVLVCCVENTVEDRIMDFGASFHVTYCKEELERFKLRSGLKRRIISIGQLDEEGYYIGFEDQIGMSMLASKGNIPDVRKVDIYFCKPGGLGKQKNLSFIMSVKTKKLQRLEQIAAGVTIGLHILEEEWRGKDTSLTHLKVFGCDSFVKVKDVCGEAMKYTFIGSGSDEMRYNFWDTKSHQVIRSRDITFMDSIHGARSATDSSSLTKLIQKSRVVLVDIPKNLAENDSIVAEHGLSSEITQSLGGSSDTSKGSENSESFEDNGRSYEEYSEDGASSKEGGSETLKVRRSNIESWAPKKAINEEMVSFEKNQTCSLVRISAGKKASQRLWMFKVKEEQNDRKNYKAILVVKGFQQKWGVDYNAIFSPVLKMTIISDVHQVGDEIEVEVLRSFNSPPSELITGDGFLPERGYSQKVRAVALLKGRWFEVYRDYLRRRAVKLSASKWEIVEL